MKGMSNTRFENIPLKACCRFMDDTLMMNDLRQSIVFNQDEPEGSMNRFMILWNDGDCIPMLYCPSCGKKVEEVRTPTTTLERWEKE